MFEGKVEPIVRGYPELMNKHLCPECGGQMTEIDRVNENGFAFIWYECTQPNCDGQCLAKMSA